MPDMFRSDNKFFMPIKYFRAKDSRLDSNIIYYQKHKGGGYTDTGSGLEQADWVTCWGTL